jgi:hypothetical protein
LQWKKECIKQPTEAEPKRIINNLKVQRKRKKHRFKNKSENNLKKNQNKLQQEKDFNHSSNQLNLLEKLAYHSNFSTTSRSNINRGHVQ